jgi:hypothetical protein
MEAQLNPYKREVYAIKIRDKLKNKDVFSVVTGYEVYLKRAQRSGLLDGFEVYTEGEGENLSAHITVWRKDWKHPFKHSVALSEYVRDAPIWKKTKTMIKKVVMSQGFRLCFCEELGGLPYTSDEIADLIIDVPQPPQKTPTQVAPPPVEPTPPQDSLPPTLQFQISLADLDTGDMDILDYEMMMRELEDADILGFENTNDEFKNIVIAIDCIALGKMDVVKDLKIDEENLKSLRLLAKNKEHFKELLNIRAKKYEL